MAAEPVSPQGAQSVVTALQADTAGVGLGVVGRSLRGVASPEVLERLTEVGFLASECGLHDAAQAIFADLIKIKPGNPSPLIGAAMVQARSGGVEQAIEQLQHVVDRYPDSEMAKAMLGTYLVHATRKGALALFEDVLGTGRDSAAVNVARCCFELAQQQEASGATAG
jgi:tetratricopeptide (TPR) repeat protein